MEEKTIEGITGRVVHDSDAQDPIKDYDMLGTMICNHSRYTLGHVQGNPKDTLTPEDIFVCLPLYLMDHSGLSISTEDYGCPWDSGRVGMIYVSKQKLLLEGMGDLTKDRVRGILKAEVATYNEYLEGNCYGYIIEDENGEHLASCWGYLGREADCERDMLHALQYEVLMKSKAQGIRDAMYPEEDWIQSVVNKTTQLGLEDWQLHREEVSKR